MDFDALLPRVAGLGAPIARATAHVRTLHPEFRGVSRIWRRRQSTEIRTSRHGIESTSDYQNSPVQHVIETGQWLDTVLSEATDWRFSILARHYALRDDASYLFKSDRQPDIVAKRRSRLVYGS